MVIKAVIFDMGGVILRTEDGGPREQLAVELGIPRSEMEKWVFSSPTAIQAETGEISEETHWQAVFEGLGVSPERGKHFRETFWSGDRIDLSLVNFIRGLRTKYRTGLLSNAWDGARDAIQSRFNLLDVFDVSVFSAQAGMRKPDARIFHHILQQLQAAPGEAVFVDDFIENIRAAENLGLQVVHFRNSSQAQQDVETRLMSGGEG